MYSKYFISEKTINIQFLIIYIFLSLERKIVSALEFFYRKNLVRNFVNFPKFHIPRCSITLEKNVAGREGSIGPRQIFKSFGIEEILGVSDLQELLQVLRSIISRNPELGQIFELRKVFKCLWI